MSTVSYDVVVHPAAAHELKALDDDEEDAMLELIDEMAHTRSPGDMPGVKPLTGFDGLLRVRVTAGGHRAIVALDKPALKLLLVDRRKRVYDRIEVARRRRSE